MNSVSSLNPWWAAAVILAVPIVIIAASELDERLRQRESPLRAATQTVRMWTVPFFALFALLVGALGVDADSTLGRAVETGLVLSVAYAALQVLRVWLGSVRARASATEGQPTPQLLLAVPRILVFLIAGWILIGTVWGVDLSAALAALGVTSLVVSFALQDTLSGLASGMLLLSDQPFKPGDWVNAGGTEGVVVDINWRTSRIRDRNGDMIIIPNSELAGSRVTNFTSPERLHRVIFSVQVAFTNPPTLVKAMLLDAATGTRGVLADPAPSVRVVQVDDPLMGYEVRVWVDDYAIAPRVKSDIGALVWYQSHRHNVPLPSPAQDLYLWDGVAAGQADVPTLADLRGQLRRAPLLASLGDNDLDQLAQATRRVRFAVDELIVSSGQQQRGDLVLIAEGRAMLRLNEGAPDETVVGEINQNELIWLLASSLGAGQRLSAHAITDCEVLVVDAGIAGDVASRNSELATGLNRTSEVRQRRVERLLEVVRPSSDNDGAGSNGRFNGRAQVEEIVSDG